MESFCNQLLQIKICRMSYLFCILAVFRLVFPFLSCTLTFYSIRAPTVAAVHKTKHFQTVSTDTEP
jgi:hypothetical protein